MTIQLITIGTNEAALGLIQILTGADVTVLGGPVHVTYVVRDHFAGFLALVLPFPALYIVHVIQTAPPKGYRDPPVLLRLAGSGICSLLILFGAFTSLSRGAFGAIFVSSIVAIACMAGRGTSLARR